MFQENKGVLINLNTTCVYAIISNFPPIQWDQPKVINAMPQCNTPVTLLRMALAYASV